MLLRRHRCGEGNGEAGCGAPGYLVAADKGDGHDPPLDIERPRVPEFQHHIDATGDRIDIDDVDIAGVAVLGPVGDRGILGGRGAAEGWLAGTDRVTDDRWVVG